MICRKCREAGQRSKVYPGGTLRTLMARMPDYYDEDGNLVRPRDPNIHTTEYRCSNDHRWAVKRRDGYPDEWVWAEPADENEAEGSR